MSSSTVDLGLIREAIKRNKKYEIAIRLFAERTRGRQDTSFSQFRRVQNEKYGQVWSAEEVKEFFELLERAGAGSIVYSEDIPKIVWDVHLQSMACAVLGIPEPARERRDGSVSEDSGGLRKPHLQRASLPRVARTDRAGDVLTALPPADNDGLRPHVMRNGGGAPVPIKPPSTSAAPVKFMKDGFVVEADLSKMTPAETKKLKDLLESLKK